MGEDPPGSIELGVRESLDQGQDIIPLYSCAPAREAQQSACSRAVERAKLSLLEGSFWL